MRLVLLPTALLAAAFALDRGWLLELPAGTPLIWAARGLFAIAFLLAWRFRRGRLAVAAAVLTATTEALHSGVLTEDASLLTAVACLVPINLAALGFTGEWRLSSRAGLLAAGALALQGLLVLGAARGPEAGLVTGLSQTWTTVLPSTALPTTVLPNTALPQLALLLFALSGVALIVRMARRRSPLEAGLLGALVAVFIAFETAVQPLVFLAASGAVLAVSQIENAFVLAFEDGLTGLPARRALEENLRHLGGDYAIAMVDIDHFKRLNDRHGHEVGDQVLRRVAARLARVGGGGTAYRYGGEEFTVLFPRGSAKDAEPHLEELRRSVSGRPFVVRNQARPKRKPRKKARSRARAASGQRGLKVTVSIGVADRNARRPRPAQVLKAADRALYRAKKAGRNRLVRV
ncbi:MAG: GGDEF domain-containing protein [bacterium]|nr:GGDEF domain-containing protein [bacterium]